MTKAQEKKSETGYCEEHQQHLNSKNECELCQAEDTNFMVLQSQLKALAQAARARRRAQAKNDDQPKLSIVSDDLIAETSINNSLQTTKTGVYVWAMASVLILAMAYQFAAIGGGAQLLGKGTYKTADSSMAIKLCDYTAEITSITRDYVLPLKVWTGSWTDEIELLEGQFDDSTWMKVRASGLEADGQLVLYKETAPELAVVEQMNLLGNEAINFFQKNRRYPANAAELGKAALIVNPGTGKSEQVKVFQYVGPNLVRGSGKTHFESDIKLGKRAGAFSKPIPYSIECMEIKAEPIISTDFNSYGWKTDAFVIRGRDRSGAFIKGGNGVEVFAHFLKNGQEQKTPFLSLLKPQESKICLYSGERPDKNAIQLRYGLLVFVFIGFLVSTALATLHHRIVDQVGSPKTSRDGIVSGTTN